MFFGFLSARFGFAFIIQPIILAIVFLAIADANIRYLFARDTRKIIHLNTNFVPNLRSNALSLSHPHVPATIHPAYFDSIFVRYPSALSIQLTLHHTLFCFEDLITFLLVTT